MNDSDTFEQIALSLKALGIPSSFALGFACFWFLAKNVKISLNPFEEINKSLQKIEKELNAQSLLLQDLIKNFENLENKTKNEQLKKLIESTINTYRNKSE